MTNAQSDGATSSADTLPRPGDEQSPITTTNEDRVTFSTQHFGPAKQYHQSKDQVSEEDSNTLHAQPIEEVMKWMKRHLDAYLATAEVYLEQNVDPG
jgi:hypothetical protein